MSRTRNNNRAPGAGVGQLNAWLRTRTRIAVDAGLPITKKRVVRTSSSNVEQFEASLITSFAALEREKDPDVITAQSYGMDLVRRDATGEAKRAELGDAVFELMMCHAPGGVGSRRIGVLLHVGQTLFLYLLTSARANDLEADTDDRRGNAATEIISAAVREVFEAGRKQNAGFRPEVHAREHERIVRDENHGTSLKRTFIACRVIVFAPDRRDLLDSSAQQSFSFGTLISAAAVDAIVKGMNRAEVVMQANGGYYSSVKQVPFTHEPSRAIEVDLGTGVEYERINKHRLAVVENVDEARRVLRVIVDEVLKDRIDRHGIQRSVPDWSAVADLPEVGDLPSRLPVDLKRGILLKDKSPSARVLSVKSLLSRRWVEGLRAGSITVDVPLKTEINVDLGDDVQIVTKGKRRYYRCRVGMPLPEGGWGITEQEWDEVLRRRYPGLISERTSNCQPLAGIGWNDDGEDLQYRLVTRGRYVLQCRQLSTAGSERGGFRGWDDGPKPRHLATLTSHLLHADAARAGREALAQLDAPCIPLVLSRPVPASVDVKRFDANRQQRLKDDLQTAQDRHAGARESYNEARGALARAQREGDESAVADAEEELRLAEQDKASAADAARLAKSVVAAYRARAAGDSVAASREETVSVHTATPEFIVAALEKCRGSAPLWLNVACTKLFTEWRFRVLHEVGTRDRVDWECVMVLDVAGTDATIRIPLQGSLESSSYRFASSAARTTVEDWAWRYFYLGESFAQVGTAAGIDCSGKKNSFLYKGLHEWLADAIPDANLRTAALHCPVPATRRVFWVMVTGDTADLAGIPSGFARHITEVYSQLAWLSKWSWCRDTHSSARLIALCLADAPGGRLPVHAVLAETQLSGNELLATARENGKSTTGTDTRRTPARAVAYFGKSFRRGAPNEDPNEKQLYLRPCPHKDCPERAAGRQGYASLVINVPETEQWHAVLCPHCMRLPDEGLADVRFPADYARPWSGRYGRKSQQSSARQQPDWTFVDPAFPDSGPAAPLADSGASPRPPAKQVDGRAGAVVDLRNTVLAGRRVLAIELEDDDVELFAARVAALGGLVGHRVKPSLAAVVTSPERTHARVAAAAALGVPVLTIADFLTWTPAAATDEMAG